MLYSGLPADRKAMLSSSTRSSTCGTSNGPRSADWAATWDGCTSEQIQARRTERLYGPKTHRMNEPFDREGSLPMEQGPSTPHQPHFYAFSPSVDFAQRHILMVEGL